MLLDTLEGHFFVSTAKRRSVLNLLGAAHQLAVGSSYMSACTLLLLKKN